MNNLKSRKMVDYIERAQEALKTHRFRSTQVPELVLSILKENSWKHRDPSPGKLEPKKFEYFPEFVETATPWGLQTDFKELENICRGFVQVELALTAAKSKDGIEITDEKYKKIRKTERQRNLERLKDERTDLFKKVESKKMTLSNALLEAGFIKKRAKIQKSPEGFAKYILDHFSSKQREQIIKLLKEK